MLELYMADNISICALNDYMDSHKLILIKLMNEIIRKGKIRKY